MIVPRLESLTFQGVVMSNSLLALCDLVESLEMPNKSNRQAGVDILHEQIRIIRIELRSMIRVLRSKSKHDPDRYRMESHVAMIEKDLRCKRWELKQLAS